RFRSVCAQPVFVPEARRALDGSGVRVCTVVGFPLGADAPGVKAAATRQAIEDGATEIDMVLFVGGLKARETDRVRDDIRSVVEVCHAAKALCKVILETCLLTDDEKNIACDLCMEAGADYVKTSTGFSTGGATEADIARMKARVAVRGLGVKASGGIRTRADALRMLAAGATRLGASSSVRIVTEG
ncbi:MAG: deoxyribose-phosphate aldolase, partial [Kiritimatiellia bacterium]|nr:deoxyribose-phosphate aldolase [Kiritimatiellia bacterium]